MEARHVGFFPRQGAAVPCDPRLKRTSVSPGNPLLAKKHWDGRPDFLLGLVLMAKAEGRDPRRSQMLFPLVLLLVPGLAQLLGARPDSGGQS